MTIAISILIGFIIALAITIIIALICGKDFKICDSCITKNFCDKTIKKDDFECKYKVERWE